MSVYVFLGPTLPVSEARAIVDACYLPPVSMGDICRIMEREPKLIAIIDGFFEGVPAVWHKEILYALSKGVKVMGSSSMGALRAAELYPYGMEGVGQVFEKFRDGLYEGDDEVAVAHAPAEFGYRPISEAMVNIREGLKRAEGLGVISSVTHRLLLHSTQETFYRERTWHSLITAGMSLGCPPQELKGLRDFVDREHPDVKRTDAIALLNKIAEYLASGLRPSPPNFSFNPTSFWMQMVRTETINKHGRETP